MTKDKSILHNEIKMKPAFKLPLYLGLFVLVVSVLVSAIKIGNQSSLTTSRTRANTQGASLILKYTPPNSVSILVSSDKKISGADITLLFNSEKITVLPSTLQPGLNLVTSGGIVDENKKTFSFSVIPKDKLFTDGLLATFTVNSNSGKGANGDVQFVTPDTQVIDKDTGQNILKSTQGVKFTLF